MRGLPQPALVQPGADKDLTLITRLFFLIEAVAVHPALGVTTVAELKTLAQSKARALNWGTLGAGSAPELFLRWINNQWGTDIVGIPYRGGGPMAQALAGNEIQVGAVGLGNFLGLAEGGKVKVIAVSAPKRSSLAPDVMTFDEAGLGGYPQRGWWGLATPKGTPKPVVDKLADALDKALDDPGVKKRIADLGGSIPSKAERTPAAFEKYVKAEIDRWAPILTTAK